MQYRSRTAPYRYSLSDIRGHVNPAMKMRKIFVGAFALLSVFIDVFVMAIIIKKGVIVFPIIALGIAALLNLAYFALNFFLNYDYRVSLIFNLGANLGSFLLFAVSYIVIASTHSIDVTTVVLADILPTAAAVAGTLIALRFLMCAAGIFAAYFVKGGKSGAAASVVAAIAVTVSLMVGVYGTLPTLFSDFGESYRQVVYRYDETNNYYTAVSVRNGVNTDTALVAAEVDGVPVGEISVDVLTASNVKKIKILSGQPLAVSGVLSGRITAEIEVPQGSIDEYRRNTSWKDYRAAVIPALAEGETAVLFETEEFGYIDTLTSRSGVLFDCEILPGIYGELTEIAENGTDVLRLSYQACGNASADKRIFVNGWKSKGSDGKLTDCYGKTLTGVNRVYAETSEVYKVNLNSNTVNEGFVPSEWTEETYVSYKNTYTAVQVAEQTAALFTANKSDRTGYSLTYCLTSTGERRLQSVTDFVGGGSGGEVSVYAVWRLNAPQINFFGGNDGSEDKNSFVYGEEVSVRCDASHILGSSVNYAYTLLSPDGASKTFDGVMQMGRKGVAESGVYSVTVTATVSEYGVTKSADAQAAFNLLVNPKTITLISVTASDRQYDGTTAVRLQGGELDGVLSGDDVKTENLAGRVADKNVGTNKRVTVSGALTGESAANYALAFPSLTVNISQRQITLTGISAVERAYDGTTAVRLSGGSLSDTAAGDDIYFTASGTVNDKNAGSGKSVTIECVLNGADRNNYAVGVPDNVTVNVTPKQISLTGMTAVNRTYDGTTAVRLNGGALSGIVSGDDVSFTANGATENKNVGSGKRVVIDFALHGADRANYSVTLPDITVAITALDITLENVTAVDRDYDGTTAVQLSGGNLSGTVSEDDIGFTASGTVAYKYVGRGVSVTVKCTLIGADRNNYRVTVPDNVSVDIAHKQIFLTDVTAVNKVYDGTTDVQIDSGDLSGVIDGDIVSFEASGTAEDKNVGNGKNVTVECSLGARDGANYSVTVPADVTVDITKKQLHLNGTTFADKVYDGTTTVAISGSRLVGTVSGDDVGFTASAFVNDKNAGIGKSVTIVCVLTGADKNNYTEADLPINVTVDITPAQISLTGITAVNRVYDGTTAVLLQGGALSGVIDGDEVGFTASGAVSDKNVGNGKKVTVTCTLSGADGRNYSVTVPADLMVNITPKQVTLTGITAVNREYDGTTAVQLDGGALSGVISGDEVGFTASGTVNDKNVGSGKKVTVICTLSGADSGNYIYAESAYVAQLTVDIAKKRVTINIDDKTSAEGENLVSLSASVEGARAGEEIAYNLTTDADKNAAGEYDITGHADENNAVNANYEITFSGSNGQSGKYTVTAAEEKR